MSILIVGGADCMVRRYKKLCRKYRCKAMVFVKMIGSMKGNLEEYVK